MQITEWHRKTAADLAAVLAPPASPGPLRPFVVTIGQRNAPRLQFEAMARTSFDAVQQNDGLRQEGERIEVSPKTEAELVAMDHAFAADRFNGSLQQEADERALQAQCSAQVRREWTAR